MENKITSYLSQLRSPAFPGSFFLSFEGIEGSGKSTQIVKAKEYLESLGINVIVIREPGGTSFGEKLRKAILESDKELHPLAEAHLFASSRTELLQEVVLQELAKPGTVVICDRYLDSSIAYQGMARELGVETILEIHSRFPLNLVPHLTFYLQIDLETSMLRQKIRNAPKDYFEKRGADFYQRLIQGYELCKELFSDRIHVINGKNPESIVQSEIRSALDLLLHKR